VFAVNFVAQSAQMASHRSKSPGGGLQILLVNEPHELQIHFSKGFGTVEKGGSVDVKQPELVCNAQAGLIGIHHLLSLFPAYRLSFLDKKSRSTFNRPICL
jgi:hypothetical protein